MQIYRVTNRFTGERVGFFRAPTAEEAILDAATEPEHPETQLQAIEIEPRRRRRCAAKRFARRSYRRIDAAA
jgi:hypothetical protein